MSEQQKPTDDQRDDESIMSDEELESVSGGCQWGNETMYPKFPDTIITPTLPIDPFTLS